MPPRGHQARCVLTAGRATCENERKTAFCVPPPFSGCQGKMGRGSATLGLLRGKHEPPTLSELVRGRVQRRRDRAGLHLGIRQFRVWAGPFSIHRQAPGNNDARRILARALATARGASLPTSGRPRSVNRIPRITGRVGKDTGDPEPPGKAGHSPQPPRCEAAGLMGAATGRGREASIPPGASAGPPPCR